MTNIYPGPEIQGPTSNPTTLQPPGQPTGANAEVNPPSVNSGDAISWSIKNGIWLHDRLALPGGLSILQKNILDAAVEGRVTFKALLPLVAASSPPSRKAVLSRAVNRLIARGLLAKDHSGVVRLAPHGAEPFPGRLLDTRETLRENRLARMTPEQVAKRDLRRERMKLKRLTKKKLSGERLRLTMALRESPGDQMLAQKLIDLGRANA